MAFTKPIDSLDIEPGSIERIHLTNNVIGPDELAPDSVTSDAIASGAVTPSEIANNAIQSTHISDNAITTPALATNAVIANKIAANAITSAKIAADAITTNLLSANAITAKHTIVGARHTTALTGSRTEFNADGLFKYRDNGEEVINTVAIGGSSDDQIMLYDSSGTLTSGFTATGDGVVSGTMFASGLNLNGDDIQTIIDRKPKGIICYLKAVSDSLQAGSGALGYALAQFNSDTTRLYRARIHGMMAVTTANDVAQVAISILPIGGGSTVIQIGNFPIPSTTACYIDLDVYFPGPLDGTARIGFTYKNATANRAIFWSGRATYPVECIIEDMGAIFYNEPGVAPIALNTLGGTPIGGTGSTDTTGELTYTKEYAATWTRSWGNGGIVTDYLNHGYYTPVQRYSMVGFGGTLASDLSGATILSAQLYIKNASWWGASGNLYLGSATNTSAPASPVTSGTTAITTIAEGAATWATIGGFTTASRAVTMGAGAGTSTNNYGKFYNTNIKLRVKYKK